MTSGLSIAFLAAIYLVLLIWLGIRTLRPGHWVMLRVGIFIPLFWISGALIPRRREYSHRRAFRTGLIGAWPSRALCGHRAVSWSNRSTRALTRVRAAESVIP